MNPFEVRTLSALAFLYAARMLGLFMVLPVFAIYAPDYVGATALGVGLALGVYGLTQGLLQIPFGLLSDRFGRKPVLFIGMGIFLIGSLLAACAESITALIVARALQGAGAVASVVMALLSDVVKEQNRTRAMAAVGGSIGLSFAVAMVAAPFVASSWGMQGVFWATAVLALAGIAVLFFVPSPATRHSGHDVIPVPSMFGAVLKAPDLLRLDVGIFVLHFVQMAIWVSLPVLLQQRYGFLLDRHWALYLGTMGAGFLFMIPLIWYGETRHKLKIVFNLAIVLLVLAECVMVNAGHRFGVMVFGLLLFFTAFNILEASLPSLVSKFSPAGIKGTAMGVYSTSQFIGAFLGGLVGGVLTQTYGLDAVFWAAIVASLVWLLVALKMTPPRKLRSIEVGMGTLGPGGLTRALDGLPGVVEVVVIPGEQLAYVKVDDDNFDPVDIDAVLASRVSG